MNFVQSKTGISIPLIQKCTNNALIPENNSLTIHIESLQMFLNWYAK